MIELRNLSAGYGGKTVVSRVDLAFAPGKITVLLGPNGCGKSTLLKSIVGLSQVTGGDILADNLSYVNYKPSELARLVSYLPQGRQVPDITAERMVLHGRFPWLGYPRRYRERDYAVARDAMERVGIAELAAQPLAKLSGGTRQKVYIAMALAQDTPTILLDEPTTHLDIAYQLQLVKLCRELADSGKAVVLVLHDLPLALEHGDHIALLHGGRLVTQGTPEEVYRSGALEYAFGVRLHTINTESGTRYFCCEI